MRTTPENPDLTEFPRPVSAETLTMGESRQRLSATPEECTALAKRFELVSLENFSADIMLNRKGQGQSLRVTLKGTLRASLTQTCVISLDPIEASIEADFETTFDADADRIDSENENDFSQSEEGPDELIIDGVIDLGETVAQFLALEINPFPRKAGTDSSEIKLEAGESRPNPFAILKKLKTSQK